jgi:hypothetical protein
MTGGARVQHPTHRQRCWLNAPGCAIPSTSRSHVRMQPGGHQNGSNRQQCRGLLNVVEIWCDLRNSRVLGLTDMPHNAGRSAQPTSQTTTRSARVSATPTWTVARLNQVTRWPACEVSPNRRERATAGPAVSEGLRRPWEKPLPGTSVESGSTGGSFATSTRRPGLRWIHGNPAGLVGAHRAPATSTMLPCVWTERSPHPAVVTV